LSLHSTGVELLKLQHVTYRSPNTELTPEPERNAK
jgi:hypothetical protein